LRHVFFKGHSYVPEAVGGGHENSVTQDPCFRGSLVIPNPGFQPGEFCPLSAAGIPDQPDINGEMREESSIDPGGPFLTTQEEQIRRLRVAELEATLDHIGAEAQARGLAKEILNKSLNEELTAEGISLNGSRALLT
jgi:hypothetical protein